MIDLGLLLVVVAIGLGAVAMAWLVWLVVGDW